MNKTLIAVAAVATLLAGTATAQDNAGFTGVRAEAYAGINDFHNARSVNDVSFTGAVGVDAPLGDNFTFGVEGTADTNETYGVGARLGYAVNSDTLVFARAGYDRFDDARTHTLEGLSLGGGVEWRISERSFVSAEYRHTDFDRGVGSHAGLLGVGIRF